MMGEEEDYMAGREERDPRKRKRMSEEGVEERRSRSRERRRRSSEYGGVPQDPRLQVGTPPPSPQY